MLKPWFSCVVAVALIVASAPVQAADLLSTTEMTGLSPAVANRKAQRDLLSILQPTGQFNSGMRIRLGGAYLLTHAVGTEFEGLCRHDAVSLLYAPAETSAPPREQPLRPFGIEAQVEFHIMRLPLRQRPHYEGRVDQGGCGALDRDENVDWFTARDVRQAAQGANVLEMALDLVREGPTSVLTCSNVKDCHGLVQQWGDMRRIDSIEPCEARSGEICFVIDVAGTLELRIVGKTGPDEFRPTAILSIQASQYIIVT